MGFAYGKKEFTPCQQQRVSFQKQKYFCSSISARRSGSVTNPNLWQNRAGSETEGGFTEVWKSKGDRSSALREGHRSPSRAALGVRRAAGTKVAQKRARAVFTSNNSSRRNCYSSVSGLQNCNTSCFHAKKKRAKSVLVVWDLYFGTAAKMRRDHHTPTSSVTTDSLLGKD